MEESVGCSVGVLADGDGDCLCIDASDDSIELLVDAMVPENLA